MLASEEDVARRKRLKWSATLLGCALSVAAVHVQLISRIEWFRDAHHLDFWPAVFFSIGAAVAALIVLPWAVFYLRDRPHVPGGILVWLALGLWFGVSTPFLTGGFSPMSRIFIDFAEGGVALSEMPSLMVDAVLIGLRDFFVEGAIAFPAGLLAGAFFAVFGYVIDRLNSAHDRNVSTYGPWVLAVVVGGLAVTFVVAASPETIRELPFGFLGDLS